MGLTNVDHKILSFKGEKNFSGWRGEFDPMPLGYATVSSLLSMNIKYLSGIGPTFSRPIFALVM